MEYAGWTRSAVPYGSYGDIEYPIPDPVRDPVGVMTAGAGIVCGSCVTHQQ